MDYYRVVPISRSMAPRGSYGALLKIAFPLSNLRPLDLALYSQCPSQKERPHVAAFSFFRDSFLGSDSRPCLRLIRGSSCGSGFVQDSVMDREERKLQPVRNSDFVVHIPQIILDHLLGRPQL
jgi:hypothetical protein